MAETGLSTQRPSLVHMWRHALGLVRCILERRPREPSSPATIRWLTCQQAERMRWAAPMRLAVAAAAAAFPPAPGTPFGPAELKRSIAPGRRPGTRPAVKAVNAVNACDAVNAAQSQYRHSLRRAWNLRAGLHTHRPMCMA